MRHFVAQIRCGYQPVGGNFPLDRDIPLLHVRRLRAGKRQRVLATLWVRRVRSGVERERIAAGKRGPGIIERRVIDLSETRPRRALSDADAKLSDLRFVEDAVGGTHHGASVSDGIPDQTQPWRKLVQLVRDDGGAVGACGEIRIALVKNPGRGVSESRRPLVGQE